MDKYEQKKIDDERRKEIGRRIREERKRTKNPDFSNGRCYSQELFAEKLHISKQAYNNLENGVGEPKLEYLYRIKELCGCDIGYLVGEYDCRTKEATDICKATGLTEQAVEVLLEDMRKISKSRYLDSLSAEELEAIPEEEFEDCTELSGFLDHLLLNKDKLFSLIEKEALTAFDYDALEDNYICQNCDMIYRKIVKKNNDLKPNEDKITYIMNHYDEMITELKKKPSLKPFLDMAFAPFPEGEFTVEDVLSMVVRFYIQALQEKEERGFRRYKIQQLFMSIVEDYLPKKL